MKATEELELEHRTTELAIDACREFSTILRDGREVPVGALHKLVRVLHIYDEQYHLEQEEWLFSILTNKGAPRGNCPIASLTHENYQRGMLVSQLANAVDVYEQSACTARFPQEPVYLDWPVGIVSADHRQRVELNPLFFQQIERAQT